jgi:hypothetical protein
MGAQAIAQKKELGLEGPSLHILIEVLEVGVLGYGLVIRTKTQALREELYERGLARAYVASEDQVFFHIGRIVL